MRRKTGDLPEVGKKVVAYSSGIPTLGIYKKPKGWKYGRLRTAPGQYVIWSNFVEWEAAE